MASSHLGMKRCGLCKLFAECRKTKGVLEGTNYCQWQPNRFELADEYLNWGRELYCSLDDSLANPTQVNWPDTLQEKFQGRSPQDRKKFS